MQLDQLESLDIDFYDVKDQLKQLVFTRSMAAFDAGDHARDNVHSRQQLEERNKRMREALLQSLGGLPSNDAPLQPHVTGVVQCNGYRIEKIIFQSRPDTYVTSNLYIPEGISSPRGAVLFLCGHFDTAKHADEYQTVCQYLVSAGLVVFAIDPIGQGERLSYYEPSLGKAIVEGGCPEHDHAGTQCWLVGDSLARYFVHDAMRAVDYLCTRSEVDPAKIGVTGNSGGGMQSSLMMICDPRIAAAAPATFIMNRRSYIGAGQAQDAEQIWPGLSAAGFDHEDILMAMVPRPVLILAASYDFFPIEGTRSTVERTRRFWEMHHKGDHLSYFEEPEVHKYSIAMAKQAAAFFAKHLLTEAPGPLKISSEIEPLDPSLLWCTQSGQVREDYALARAVYEENVDRLDGFESTRAGLSGPERKEKALIWLKGKVHAWRKPCSLNPRVVQRGQLDELTVHTVAWWSQEGLLNHGLMFRDCSYMDHKLPLTIAVWEEGTRKIGGHFSWIRETCSTGRAVMVLDVTGVGALSPNAVNGGDLKGLFGTFYKLTTDLFWLDDSLAALRTYDVLRALDLAEILPDMVIHDLTIYAKGRYSLFAQLATVLDERVKQLKVEDGMESVASLVKSRDFDKYDVAGLILPGMLQYFDLPDLAEWSKERGLGL
ncbi:alpha/beta hydrolase family protein [Cohnella soli]|uniref:Alpha/beta hydrolase family protein n=1 Tax=Cohnella soli TaxID=425005 RepID=A0ABW0HQL1_9BACL